VSRDIDSDRDITAGAGAEPGPQDTRSASEGDAAEPGPSAEAENVSPAAPALEEHEAGPSRFRRWRRRRSIRAIRRLMAHDIDQWREFDKPANDASRLPPGEEVHLGGIVFVEAFTPSTAAKLKKALEEFAEGDDRKDEWLAGLERGRRATGSGGWCNLGCVRRPGNFSLTGSFDPEIPEAVDAIWLKIFYLTPSLTLVVATFTIKDDQGNLSDLMRADYKTTFSAPRILLQGRLRFVRRHIPWARPKNFRVSQPTQGAEHNRMLACEATICRREEECWTWFSKRFPGVFSDAGRKDAPTVRILLTKEKVPFEDYNREFAPVGLSSRNFDVWNSMNEPGWKMSSDVPQHASQPTLIAAARIRDAAQAPGEGVTGDSTWYLTAFFSDHQSQLIARWATSQLLSFYTDRLAALRDRAGQEHRIARPVGEAQALDKFMIRDGLDASTITSDLDVLTSDLSRFRFDAPEYSEDLSSYPAQMRSKRQPAELLPTLCDSIKAQGVRLRRDTEAATTNIAASAELRQAIANTQLQRRVIVLTIVSIIIALASLYVAIASIKASK
jgi:hypothetical protein